MNKTLQEIVDALKEVFPKVSEKTFIKIIFSIKSRKEIFGNGNIGLSRKEAMYFGTSEATLQNIIYFLRNFGLIEKVGTRKIKGNDILPYKICNLYKVSDFFDSLLKDLEFITKKVFQYINPIDFVLKYFKPKFKYGLYKFKVNGNRYYIYTKGKFKNVIYGEAENKIINPLSLLGFS